MPIPREIADLRDHLATTWRRGVHHAFYTPWSEAPIDTMGGHDPRSRYVEEFWLPTLGREICSSTYSRGRG